MQNTGPIAGSYRDLRQDACTPLMTNFLCGHTLPVDRHSTALMILSRLMKRFQSSRPYQGINQLTYICLEGLNVLVNIHVAIGVRRPVTSKTTWMFTFVNHET